MDNLIFGIRPVAEAIEAGKQIEKLYIRKGADGQLMSELRDLCVRHRVHYQEVPVEKLNRLTRGNHQGSWHRRPPSPTSSWPTSWSGSPRTRRRSWWSSTG